MNSATERTGVLSIAHRGCAEQAPENTLAAIRRSAPHVDAIEIDVMRCGSGELVLFHDHDLARVTGYRGRIDDTSWERIADLTVFDSGEPIPRLASAIDTWPTDTMLNLDIHEPGLAPDALDVCEPLDEPILLSSTSTAVLQEGRGIPSVSLGYSFSQTPDANVETAVDHGCEYIHVAADLALNSDVIDQAHAQDLSVDVWTVRQRSTLRRLTDRGADAVTVDRWDILEI